MDIDPSRDSRLDPIGVFDSGIGGLTVAAALMKHLPSETIFYIGDTARVPYGEKAGKLWNAIASRSAASLLVEQAKMIVVACNTASALAVPRMKELFKVPVRESSRPVPEAALRATRNERIGVIGTRATIASGAYEHAIHAINPEAKVFSHACPLLVPLIEEGMFDDFITDQVIDRYLAPLWQRTSIRSCSGAPTIHSPKTLSLEQRRWYSPGRFS